MVELRTRVFVDEQGVPPEEEIDGLDSFCLHVVAETAGGRVVGTGRLMPEGRIGRMAVDAEWRGRGIGRALLDALVERARERGFTSVMLHSQIQAMDFYEAAGFQAEGPEFVDAGIAHRRMTRTLEGKQEPPA